MKFLTDPYTIYSAKQVLRFLAIIGVAGFIGRSLIVMFDDPGTTVQIGCAVLIGAIAVVLDRMLPKGRV